MVYPTKEIQKGGYTVHWQIQRGKHTQGDQQSWTLSSASAIIRRHSLFSDTAYTTLLVDRASLETKVKHSNFYQANLPRIPFQVAGVKKKSRIFLQHNSTRPLPLSIPAAPARMEAPVCFSRCAGVWPGGVFANGVWLGVPSGVCPGDTRGGVIAIAISWQAGLHAGAYFALVSRLGLSMEDTSIRWVRWVNNS